MALFVPLLLVGCETPDRTTAPPSEVVPLASKFAVTGFDLASVSAGGSHTCGVTSYGQAFCWGQNSFGELGKGSTGDSSSVPVPVSAGLTFTSVSAGLNHTCGVTKGGQALCWGRTSRANSAAPSSANASNVPVPVFGALTFAAVSAGDRYTCGVVKGRQAFCWGSNHLGQLGIGSTGGTRSAPVPVGGSTFTSVSSGAAHTCGVTKALAAWCWGLSASETASGVPLLVSGGFTFTSVSAGLNHTCGVTKALGAWCWGRNERGQLGNGSNTNSDGPSPVVTP
jgi:alpha-tubulin suppressor-like RCC1 family protein